MIVSGRAIAQEILEQTREQLGGRSVRVRAISVAPGAATESYLSTKAAKARSAGMRLEIVRLLDTATTEEVIAACQASDADALLVQLPLPESIDTKAVLDAIPLSLDADVLSTTAHTSFESGEGLLPPVTDALKEILERCAVATEGKKAVVIGSGWLVGEPCASWLTRNGADVTVITKESGDLSSLKDADIVVCGAGTPGLVQPGHLKDGVVLIDAGTSESGGAIVGDAAPECESVASVFTPVPGGVGPIAVACLFRNAGILALRNGGKAL